MESKEGEKPWKKNWLSSRARQSGYPSDLPKLTSPTMVQTYLMLNKLIARQRRLALAAAAAVPVRDANASRRYSKLS